MKLSWVTIAMEKLKLLPDDTVNEILDVISKEVGEYKLEAQAREEARRQLGVDASIADGWKNIHDILKHIDTVELAKKYPSASKKLLVTILGAIGMQVPVVLAAAGAAMALPDDLASSLIQLCGSATPEHIINKMGETMSGRAALPEGKSCEAIPLRGDTSEALAVVCKNPDIAEHIRKYTDVDFVLFNEKAWQLSKNDPGLPEKVLFIGGTGETDALIGSIEPKYDRFGIVYGWTNDRAVLTADVKKLSDKELYTQFLSQLESVPMPEKLKQDSAKKLDLLTVGKVLFATPLLIKNHYDKLEMIRQQQLFYGLYSMCLNGLEDFLNA